MAVTVNALFDAHVHFRQGMEMREFVHMTARQAGAAIAMPNTDPPLTTEAQCEEYTAKIYKYAADIPYEFKARVFAYLVPTMRVPQVKAVLECDSVVGLKLYPKAGTTNSEHGVPESMIREPDVRMYDICKTIEDLGKTLSIHCEMPSAFLLDREREFLKSNFITRIWEKCPNLRVTLEHISTKESVEFIKTNSSNNKMVRGTITWHHMIHNVGDVVGRPHNFCRPCPSLPADRDAVALAALSGDVRFMLGSDSAPHSQKAKHAECCSAGCYTAPTLIEELLQFFYTTKFHDYKHDYVKRFNQFGSGNASQFYSLELPKREIVLEEAESPVLTTPPLDEDKARWYRYPQLSWKIRSGGFPAFDLDQSYRSGDPLRR